MKTAVVFFSHDGSTRVAAKIIAGKTGADMYELEEVKKRGRSAFSFIAAGFSASIGKRSRLKNSYSNEMQAYGRVYVGTPVWAGKAVPAVNAFVHSLIAAQKDIIVFTVQADPNPDTAASKSMDKLKSALESKGAATVVIIRLYGASPGKTAAEDEMRVRVEKKL